MMLVVFVIAALFSSGTGFWLRSSAPRAADVHKQRTGAKASALEAPRAGRGGYARGIAITWAFGPDADALPSLMRRLATDAGLDLLALPECVRLRRPGDLVFAFNYGTEPLTAPFAEMPILSKANVAAGAVIRCGPSQSCSSRVRRGLATAEPTSGVGRRLHWIR